MTNTYYTSLSGMMAASYGLQNTSHNVANMQSPGFKRSEVFYSSLGYNHQEDQLGSGVCVGGHSTNFSAGNYLETGNPADLAIVGTGFFVVRLKNGELHYTRDGEFGFNKEGFLIDKHSQGLVQGYNQHHQLIPIQQNGPQHSPGKATHIVDLHGDLVSVELKPSDSPEPPNPDPEKSNYEPIRFTVGKIYDEQGNEQQITIQMEAPGSIGGAKSLEDRTWKITSIQCDNAEISFDPQSIEFNSNSEGNGVKGKNFIRFLLNGTQEVVLNFGDYESNADAAVHLSKKAANKTNTSIEVKQQDGYGQGKQIGFSFDDNGQISYLYDNGQSIAGTHVALAHFDDLEHNLIPANDNLFRAKTEQGRHLGRANKEGFGSIQPKKLESANVDSTTEFANIVVLQRMFQACSQIMDIDKQLLEELYKK